ncbi:MAG: hypothetical protein OEQ39_11640 [Gammaproteobacteria bacterium]|nr:hypothetical protein [Gammaproteobacteria bacterium]MDH3468719.1 hypothetical protein [Gammaproteobacteria bacterium]
MQANRYIPIAAFALALCGLFVGLLAFGTDLGGDANRYVGNGRQLWNGILGEAELGPLTVWQLFYLVPNLLISAGDRWIGEAFYGVSIGLNLAAFSTMVALLFALWTHYAKRPPGWRFVALALILMFALTTEVVRYNYAAYSSDILAMSWIGVCWYALGHAVLRRSMRCWLGAFAVAAVALFVRPTGVAVMSLVIAAALYVGLHRRLRSPVVLAAALIVLPALFAVTIWPYIITLNMEGVAWADRIVPNDVYNKYIGGVVVGIRPETYVVNPGSYGDFIEITLRRFSYYFVPLRSGYSLLHLGVNIAYIVYLWFLLYSGWRSLRAAGPPAARLAFLVVLGSYYFGVFHAMTFVEDWRYELPLWPGLWLLAGFGLLDRLGMLDIEGIGSAARSGS